MKQKFIQVKRQGFPSGNKFPTIFYHQTEREKKKTIFIAIVFDSGQTRQQEETGRIKHVMKTEKRKKKLFLVSPKHNIHQMKSASKETRRERGYK